MYEIDKLDVNPKVIASLKAAKIFDCKSILLASSGELSRATKLPCHEVALLVKAVSLHVVKSKLNVPSLQLLSEEKSTVARISIGCQALDGLLKGGIPRRGITEVCGESGSGKTQFCLQLSLWAQLPPDEGHSSSGVVYICTECVFPIKRLYQLIKGLVAKKTADHSISDNIIVCQIGDASELKQCVQRYLPALVKARRVRVVIVDSVAAIFRTAYNANETRNRAEDLQSLGYSLHRLSQSEKVAVVCVNQVTDTMSDSHVWCGPMDSVAPALGLSWANMVTTRLMLSRTLKRTHTLFENGQEVSLSVPAVICKATVVYAPDLPRNCAYYAVTKCGLKGIDQRTFNESTSLSVDRIFE